MSYIVIFVAIVIITVAASLGINAIAATEFHTGKCGRCGRRKNVAYTGAEGPGATWALMRCHWCSH